MRKLLAALALVALASVAQAQDFIRYYPSVNTFANPTAGTDHYHWWWNVTSPRAAYPSTVSYPSLAISDTDDVWIFNGRTLVFATPGAILGFPNNTPVSGAHLLTSSTNWLFALASTLTASFEVDDATEPYNTVTVWRIRNFQDSPVMEINRLAVGPGNTNTSPATFIVADKTASTGSTSAVFRGGAGQSTAQVLTVTDNADATVFAVDASGTLHGGFTTTLTEASATPLLQIAVPVGDYAGGALLWTLFCGDGTDYVVREGHTEFAAVNKAGTETCGVTTNYGGSPANAASAGSITDSTITCTTTPANGVLLNMTAACDLNQTTLSLAGRLEMPHPQAVTKQ